jgi:hypothetical protein
MTSWSGKYRWVDTLGGPHLLISEEQLQYWRGEARWKSDDRSDESDYVRACTVDTWLGEIPCHSATALVLAGDVGPIAWFPNTRNDGGFLVQWIGIDKEDDIESSLRTREMADLLASGNTEEIEFSTGASGLMRLIDSVDPGNELKSGSEAIELEPGRYRMRAAYFESASLSMVVRRISRV